MSGRTRQGGQEDAARRVASEPTVSIIILTYNSEATIGRCLHALLAVDYPQEKLEFIVLDNGSSDTTLDILAAAGLRPEIRPELNLSQLRNRGAEKAGGEIIAFVDSDCVVASDWVRQAVKWFKDPAVGIAGNEYLLPEDASLFERNWYAEANDGVKYDELIPAGNMAIRRDHFRRLGGFDDSLQTGEDDYIVGVFRANGLQTVSDHRIRSIHLGNAKNLRRYFHKEIWYGLGMLGTVRFSRFDKPLLATLLFFAILLTALLALTIFAVSGAAAAIRFASATALAALAIPLAAALQRIYGKNRRGNLLYVMLVFIVFFTARLCALAKLAVSRTKQRKGEQTNPRG